MAKTKIAYVTLLDQYHPGIYDSQVIDVCEYLSKNFKVKVKLIAFLSIRELRNTNAKQQIKEKYPNSMVLPAFPKLKYFMFTKYLLAIALFFYRPKALICRNVFATQIGLASKNWGLVKKVVFDGRSALAAEIKEYDVFPVNYIRKNIAQFEKVSVLESDFKIAVSNQLVDYWKENYSYSNQDYTIVPCTLHSNFNWSFSQKSLTNDKVKVVYAGSNAPWQGFDLIEQFLRVHKEIYCTLLTKESKKTASMEKEFGERLQVKWINSEEVSNELANADYGLLLRPKTVTNRVASPGKFAEYLSCGLPVILSSKLGDYSRFVAEQNCGVVWNGEQKLSLNKTSLDQKEQCHLLANKYFRKEGKVIHAAYKKLIEAIG